MTTLFEAIYAAARKPAATATLFGAMAAAICALPSGAAAQTPSPLFPLPPQTVSTVPANGDVNPYGVSFVPRGFRANGVLQPSDILVSNFNNSSNLQGTGTTIVRIDAHGQPSLFFQGQSGLGLTAALGVLRGGFVLVGNTPTTDGTSATITAGSLLVIDRNGNLAGALSNSNLINGPWGMAIHDAGDTAQVFISNVLSGTVTRLDLALSPTAVVILRATQIGSGFNHRTDPAALVLGPSGLYYDAPNDLLYVASSADNAVYSIPGAGELEASAGTGTMVYQDLTHLHGPIDLALAPSGDLILANSDGSNADPNQPSELVEFTPQGQFVSQFSVDMNNGGAFGVALTTIGNGAAVRAAAVDDNQNTLTTWTLQMN
jgi:hypothetical protein